MIIKIILKEMISVLWNALPRIHMGYSLRLCPKIKQVSSFLELCNEIFLMQTARGKLSLISNSESL